MPVTKNCKQCFVEFSVIPARANSAKFCSKECSRLFQGHSNEPNTVCTQCDKHYHLKPSAKKRYKRTNGYFCSNVCFATYKSINQTGSKNSNYKGRTHDQDGYRLHSPHGGRQGGLGSMKLHQAVCCEILNVEKIKGLHVHHRDCDVENNNPDNLVVLDISDHQWLHRQFGNATLWAYYHGKVQKEDLISWSDDKVRALRLLDLTVLEQNAIDLGLI